jgi:nitroreductase
MNLDDAITKRRSIRKYQDKDLPDPLIRELLDLARHAPSSVNGQPWFFSILKERERKKRLADIKNGHCPEEKRQFRADFLETAPVIVVVSVDSRRAYERDIENGILAAGYLLLAAHSRNLGAVYLSAYRSDDPLLCKEIKELLALPEDVNPVSIIPIGYPAETPAPKVLRSLDEMIDHECI